MSRIGIADDQRKCPRFQRLLHGPQQVGGLFQRDGDETLAGKAQPFDAMAIEPAMLALFLRQPAPQQRPPFLGVGEAAEGQGQREAKRCGLVAIGGGRHVMEAPACQALRREMPVDLGKPQAPDEPTRLLPLELRL